MWFLWLWLAFTAMAGAQVAFPANTTSFPSTNANNTIFLEISEGQGDYAQRILYPLTADAVSGLPHKLNSSGGLSGSLFMAAPQTAANLSSHYFALTRCDASAYSGGNLDMQDIIQAVLDAKVQAIIFYSLELPCCNISGDFGGYPWIYSLTTVADASELYSHIRAIPEPLNQLYSAGIYTQTAWLNNITRNPPGTAAAMIILYSITGLITLAFLSIIVTGAVRAHRHPERYGPRDFLGRPTQSRARGLARAMLDTIPIVKFGEKHAPKDTEVELSESGNAGNGRLSSDPGRGAAGAVGHLSTEGVRPSTEEEKRFIPGLRAVEDSGHPVGSAEDDVDAGLGCSICTDDFERGQDIRLLPCNHKFHPACVDPWLLDVSATCPLCRIDLQPQRSNSNALPTENDEAAIPTDAVSSGRLANVRRLLANVRNMSDEERRQALRRFRRDHNIQGPTAGNQVTAPQNTTSQPGDPNNAPRRSSRVRTFLGRGDRRT